MDPARDDRWGGAAVLTDGVFMAIVLTLGGGSGTALSFLLYIHLVAVTLLASYRTGLKVALWHSLLFFCVFYAQAARILDPLEQGTDAGSGFQRPSFFNVVAFWVVALAGLAGVMLIGLAVAAQIPCQFCVHFHTEAARLNGATEEEVHEAIAMAALTRHWSTVLNGALIPEAEFRKQAGEIFAVLMEPMQGSHGCLPGDLDFLNPEGLSNALQDPDKLVQAAWTPLGRDTLNRIQAFMTLAEALVCFSILTIGLC